MSVWLLLERTWYVRRPVSVYGILESWEVGVHGCRDPPGYQHTLAMNLDWAFVVRLWAIFHVNKVWAHVPANWGCVCLAMVITHIFCPLMLTYVKYFLGFLAE